MSGVTHFQMARWAKRSRTANLRPTSQSKTWHILACVGFLKSGELSSISRWDFPLPSSYGATLMTMETSMLCQVEKCYKTFMNSDSNRTGPVTKCIRDRLGAGL